jgi:Rieske 2Fe-2S family protein
VRVTWLVHEDAVEGRDYRLEDIMPFWQLTSEQDWTLCEHAQRGVCSTGYRPGPLSTYKEYNVDAFLRWLLHQLGREAASPRQASEASAIPPVPSTATRI